MLTSADSKYEMWHGCREQVRLIGALHGVAEISALVRETLASLELYMDMCNAMDPLAESVPSPLDIASLPGQLLSTYVERVQEIARSDR